MGTLLSLLLLVTSTPAEILIIAEPQPFLSIPGAAFGEHQVNWRDADLADDDACTRCFAALELQRYLRRMTGRYNDFPLKIPDLQGKNDAIFLASQHDSTLDPEGFRIETRTQRGRRMLTITGGSRVGVLYGAYRLLYELGVRWYAPGRNNEEVPHRAFMRVPVVNLTGAPAFRTRGFWAWEARGNPEFFDWMARNQMNLWTDAERNHPALKKRGIKLTCGGHIHQDRFLHPRAEYPYDHPLFEGDENKPADPYRPPPSFAGDTNGDGKLTYFEAHPEWYGLRNGKRSDHIAGGAGDNFCTSNTDAVTELVRNLVQDLIDGEWRDADTVNFWTLDGGHWCECEACKTLGTPTDRNLLLVHALRREIVKARNEGRLNRDVLVMFLAYADVIEPPTRPLPDDFDYQGCVATFFPIVRCYVHTLDDPTCTEYNARYLKHYQGWATDPQRYYRGQIFIGEYYNVSGYKCLPICFARTMEHDIPFYFRTGARHMHYMHCTTGNWGNKALTNWQLAQMLWNPNIDVKALYDDYFAGRYGLAKEPMQHFYEALGIMLCNVSELKYGLSRRLESNAENLFPHKHMRYEATVEPDNDGPDFCEMLAAGERCERFLAQAQSLPIPSRVRTRIAEDERLFRYGYNTLRFYDEVIQATQHLREGDKEAARRHYIAAAHWQNLLEADTTSTSLSSSHASAKNGYVASYITGAWTRLQSILGPVDLSALPELDLAKGPLLMWGADFTGGGAPLFGQQLRCGGKEVQASKGNYVYARSQGPRSTMQAFFISAEPPTETVYLGVSGMSCPVQRGGQVRIGVYLNDQPLFEGYGPFPECKLGRCEWWVPAEYIHAGVNRLRVDNLELEGPLGNRPWFGVDHIILKGGCLSNGRLLADCLTPIRFRCRSALTGEKSVEIKLS